MSVGTGTVGSGSQIKYVSWGAGDTIKDIFDGIASILTGSGGWTLASGTSGSFYTTYYSGATTDFRRVYSSPLLAQGSGLSTKYVMLRIATSVNITVGGASTSGFLRVQLIPFQSWNSGTDVGTNQAGVPIVNNTASTYGWDVDFLYNTSPYNSTFAAPQTLINNNSAGLLYVGYGSNAAYLVMWPYFSVNGQLFNSQRLPVLIYGEVAEDTASYANVPPVYVSTLQKISTNCGLIPSFAQSVLGPGDASPNYGGANNTFIGSLYSYYTGGISYNGFTYSPYLVTYSGPPGPLWLSPVAPGSTTSFTGIANTVRTGPQASAFQRMTLGHLGDFGFTQHASVRSNETNPTGTNIINGVYHNDRTLCGSPAIPKASLGYFNYPYQVANTHQQAGGTALNSTNFKGIEPILGGGVLSVLPSSNWTSALTTAYFTNPLPIYWQWGRMRGLKYVGSPPSPATTWQTLDTVSMTCDADGFYTKTGGTSTTFALIGFAPYKQDGTDWASGDNSANMFWAIPA